MNNEIEMTDDVSVEHQEDGKQFLAFLLAGEEYAVDILKVQEIKSWGPVTPIPASPEYMRGIINLRGTVVPVIDLRLRFGLPPKEADLTTAVIIARASSDKSERYVGLVVDEVADVYFLNESEIQERKDVSSAISGEYVQGLSQVKNQMVIVVDLDLIVHSSLIDFDEEEAA